MGHLTLQNIKFPLFLFFVGRFASLDVIRIGSGSGTMGKMELYCNNSV
jgi:hypothetical protein